MISFCVKIRRLSFLYQIIFCIAGWQENQYDLITADYPGIWTNMWEHRSQCPHPRSVPLTLRSWGASTGPFGTGEHTTGTCQFSSASTENKINGNRVLFSTSPSRDLLFSQPGTTDAAAVHSMHLSKHLDTLGQICILVLLCGRAPRASGKGRRINSFGWCLWTSLWWIDVKQRLRNLQNGDSGPRIRA